MKRAILFSLPLLALSAPGWAEQHDHATAAQVEPADPAATTTAAQQEVMDHSAMEHGEMEHGKMDMPVDQEPMAHSQMDHGSVPMPRQEAPMDASKMDHASMVDQSPIPAGPPPPEAFSGPAFAADAFVGADKMAASRASVVREVSGVPVYWFQADRAEYRAREGKDGYLWDVQGYYGGDIDKFWFKSEGEGNFGEKPESAEVQALWSHAIAPRWDIQAGVRQDLTGPERTHAVIGVQGLAPYLFELDAAAFVSNKGDITARIEGELDQRITQRLILQPRAELSLSAQDIPELGIGAGLDRAELGLRLRYEFVREFAPYIGVEQEWKVGKSADYARAAGEDPSVTNYVVGIRLWF